MSDQTTSICPQCQIGHLQSGKQTYVRVHNGLLISLPDMPGYTCDVCGYQSFDPAAIAHVEVLIGQSRPAKAAQRPSTLSQTSDGGSASLKH
jgi:YgiT-type zinc finger domain-containing protein